MKERQIAAAAAVCRFVLSIPINNKSSRSRLLQRDRVIYLEDEKRICQTWYCLNVKN